MKQSLKDLWKLSRSTLSKLWNRDVLIFLVFVAISTAFWIALSLNETYEESVSVPVRLENVPEDVVITTELPKTISVTLRDKGFNLLSYLSRRKLQPVVVDYKAHANRTGHVQLPTRSAMAATLSRLLASTQVVGFSTDTLEYFYNFGLRSKIPVRFVGEVGTQGNFVCSEIQIKPDSVTVFASHRILDTMRAVYVRPIYLHNQKDTLTMEAPLQSIRGAKFEPQSVKVHFVIDRLVEKTVKVPISQANFPANKTLRTFPAHVDITFQVGMGMYRHITPEDFVVVVNYEDLLQNNSNSINLSLKSTPEGASFVRIHPSTVEYVIEEVHEGE